MTGFVILHHQQLPPPSDWERAKGGEGRVSPAWTRLQGAPGLSNEMCVLSFRQAERWLLPAVAASGPHPPADCPAG